MVLVCLSHIKHHFEASAPSLHWWLSTTTRVATPTFLLLSGFVIQYLLRTKPGGKIALSLIDRGLFLLLVAHALLGLAELPEVGVAQWFFGRAMITDAIGVALFIAVLVRAASVSALSWIGALLCISSWFVAMTLTVESEWAKRLGSVLFSLQSVDTNSAHLPLLPYIGLFLIGMALSASLEPALHASDERAIVARLTRLGLAAIVVVAVGILAWRTVKGYVLAGAGQQELAYLVRQTLNPSSKDPPSPAYFMFYGGAGLLMLAIFFYGRPIRLILPMRQVTAVIGRASLLCFVVQDWLFFVIPKALGFSATASVPFWLVYWAGCVVALYGLALTWDRAQGNRFFTIGLKLLHRRHGASMNRPVVTREAGRPGKASTR
jgi:hypothetical protein